MAGTAYKLNPDISSGTQSTRTRQLGNRILGGKGVDSDSKFAPRFGKLKKLAAVRNFDQDQEFVDTAAPAPATIQQQAEIETPALVQQQQQQQQTPSVETLVVPSQTQVAATFVPAETIAAAVAAAAPVQQQEQFQQQQQQQQLQDSAEVQVMAEQQDSLASIKQKEQELLSKMFMNENLQQQQDEQHFEETIPEQYNVIFWGGFKALKGGRIFGF